MSTAPNSGFENDKSDYVFDGDCLSELKSMRQRVDWKVENERHPFFHRFLLLIKNWKGPLPNLRDIFEPEEIDWLLVEDVKSMQQPLYRPPLVDFVIRTGYRDQPDVDKDGKPLLYRTTAIHRAAMQSKFECIDVLFTIYDKLDVNYIDEFGFTHFHAACMSRSDHIVTKFLELGQHPDCLVQESVASLAHPPLFLALDDDKNDYRSFCRKNVVRLLLSNGANPNSVDANGMTPLHIIYKSLGDWENLAVLFFKINDERHQMVQVNVKDNLDRTPLQWAVANVCPSSVEILLDRGADLSSFVFPNETYIGSRFRENKKITMNQALQIVSDMLAILESLKKKGYELNRNDAFTVMKFCAYIEKPYWFKGDYGDDSDGCGWRIACAMCDSYKTEHLCSFHQFATISRGFFRYWALEFFLTLTCYRLPILCCELIIGLLENEDMLMMCIASQDCLDDRKKLQS